MRNASFLWNLFPCIRTKLHILPSNGKIHEWKKTLILAYFTQCMFKYRHPRQTKPRLKLSSHTHAQTFVTGTYYLIFSRIFYYSTKACIACCHVVVWNLNRYGNWIFRKFYICFAIDTCGKNAKVCIVKAFALHFILWNVFVTFFSIAVNNNFAFFRAKFDLVEFPG